MAEVVSVQKQKTYNLALGQAYIKGRIAHGRKWNNSERGTFYFTVLRIPASDEYSFPGVVELMSSSLIGRSGDDWEGVVEVTGASNNFDTKPDPRTGEIMQVKSARNWLRVVES
jgi:hypothetical protein